MDVRFTQSRFGNGYDMAEVDDFLDRCDQALASGDGSITAQSVLAMRFSPTRFRDGYNMAEVDAFLDDELAPQFAARDLSGAASGDSSPAAPSQNLRQAGPTTTTGSAHPDQHPAEQRVGFFSRLFGGR